MNAPVLTNDNGESDFNIETNHGAIYVARTINMAKDGGSTVKHKHFFNTTEVSVDRSTKLRTVFVFRGNKLVPMLNEPDLTDLDTLTFSFKQPESGYII